MIANRTQSGHGLKLILSRPEAARLAVLLARTTARDANTERIRVELLPALSGMAWNDKNYWEDLPGAVIDPELWRRGRKGRKDESQ